MGSDGLPTCRSQGIRRSHKARPLKRRQVTALLMGDGRGGAERKSRAREVASAGEGGRKEEERRVGRRGM